MKSISNHLCHSLLALALLFAITGIDYAQTPNPQTALTQSVAELQKNPTDSALREKIIKLAATMEPAPAISEETERFMARGAAAFKAAKTTEDFKDAVSEFEKATLAAPWLAEAYNNLGVTQDRAGLYDEAIASLRRYLLAAPAAPDAKQVKSLIYEIEYRREKATKDAQLAAQKAADDARRTAEETRARIEAEQQRQAAEARARAEQERRNTIEGTWLNTGSRVEIRKEGAFYRVSGLDSIFDLATYRRVGRTLTGTATPMFAVLRENFENTPGEVLQQAEGKVSMQCSLTLSDDGLTLSAERDNCAINYSRTAHPILGNLDAVYKYVSLDRVPAAFVFSLSREDPRKIAEEARARLDGERFVHINDDKIIYASVYVIEGNRVRQGVFDQKPRDFVTSPIRFIPFGDGSASMPIVSGRFVVPPTMLSKNNYATLGTISDDGQTICEGSVIYKRVN